MIRRSPTRIDFKLEDLCEYDTRNDLSKKTTDRPSLFATTWNAKLPQSEIQERIGYVPQQPQPAHPRPTI